MPRMRTTKKQKNPIDNDFFFGVRKECKLLQSNPHTRTTKEAEEMIEKQRRKRRIIFSTQMSNLGTQCQHSDILNSSAVFEAIRHVTIPSWSLDRGLHCKHCSVFSQEIWRKKRIKRYYVFLPVFGVKIEILHVIVVVWSTREHTSTTFLFCLAQTFNLLSWSDLWWNRQAKLSILPLVFMAYFSI